MSTTQHKFTTSVFRKKTSIGLYTNFTSFTPFSYKIGLIKTLTHRAFEICSSWSLFDQECNKIKTLSLKNMYPSNLIDKEIKKYLNKKFTDNTIENRDNKIVVIINYHLLVRILITLRKKSVNYAKGFVNKLT